MQRHLALAHASHAEPYAAVSSAACIAVPSCRTRRMLLDSGLDFRLQVRCWAKPNVWLLLHVKEGAKADGIRLVFDEARSPNPV
jgi:hypothetical protein